MCKGVLTLGSSDLHAVVMNGHPSKHDMSSILMALASSSGSICRGILTGSGESTVLVDDNISIMSMVLNFFRVESSGAPEVLRNSRS